MNLKYYLKFLDKNIPDKNSVLLSSNDIAKIYLDYLFRKHKEPLEVKYKHGEKIWTNKQITNTRIAEINGQFKMEGFFGDLIWSRI